MIKWFEAVLYVAACVGLCLMANRAFDERGQAEQAAQCDQALAEKTHQLQLKTSEYNLCEEMWDECYNSLSIMCGPRPITKDGFVLSRWEHYCKQFEDYYYEEK